MLEGANKPNIVRTEEDSGPNSFSTHQEVKLLRDILCSSTLTWKIISDEVEIFKHRGKINSYC